MATLQRVSVAITTDASGDNTAYSDPVSGLLHSVWYDYGTLATGADFTVTEESTGKALLTITNAGVSDLFWRPRIGTHPVANTAGGTIVAGNATTGGIGVANEMNTVVGRIKVVTAQGGDTLAGTLYFDIVRKNIRRVSVVALADASGDGTFYTESVAGFLHTVYMDYVSGDTGADYTITESQSGKALLTITNAATADLFWRPRIGVLPVANTAGGTIVPGGTTTGGEGVANEMLSVMGAIKVVVAQGGNAGTNTLYFDIIR